MGKDKPNTGIKRENLSDQFAESTANSQRDWWQGVLAAAKFILNSNIEWHDEESLRRELSGQDFDRITIDRVLQWIAKAALSGQLYEVLGMLVPKSSAPRVEHPLEKLFISDEVWREIDGFRRRDILTDDTAERLLEGIRAMDTRDWDDDEVRNFIDEVMTANGFSIDMLKAGRAKRMIDFYS